ncbi:MAG: response regulator [Alphaproteobacteria bacterium]|nr:response regulator [Alphaproteobacteria bacterium]
MSAEGETVLVVDDDDGQRYFKRRVLERAGYQVAEAERGREAIDTVRANAPGLVLLDVKLPDVSGIEVCRQLKADDPSVLVLQTSAAFTGPDDRAVALEGGADSYLVEPMEPEELVATVGAMFRLRRAELDLRRQNEMLEQRVAERTREIADMGQRLVEETRQRAETEEALRHAQKLDALGRLTGGIAHDFNNLLTVIVGAVERLERGILKWDAAGRDKLLKAVTLALNATQECSHLTNQMLAFGRRDPLRFGAVEVNEAIRRFEPLLRRAAGERVALQLRLGAELGPCWLDVGQLEAAVLNLVVNARDAMPEGGTVEISTTNVDIGTAAVPPAADLEPGKYVCITVADGGAGMAPDIVARAFEPFFTTKEVGKGSGLGLSQVYGFVKQTQGTVAIDTAPGMGTRVHLYLARTEETPAAAAGRVAAGAASGGSETILVVEDNDLVRESAIQVIGELGYRVLHAASGPLALTILRGPEPIDVLFTDVVMPDGISGIELVRQARELRPGLKVLVTSGFAGHVAAGAMPAPDVAFLPKPYAVADLAGRLRSVIDG